MEDAQTGVSSWTACFGTVLLAWADALGAVARRLLPALRAIDDLLCVSERISGRVARLLAVLLGALTVLTAWLVHLADLLGLFQADCGAAPYTKVCGCPLLGCHCLRDRGGGAHDRGQKAIAIA